MWKRERRVIEMKGYYNQEDSGTGLEVPTGRLSIEVKNLPEFLYLINQSYKEAEQLRMTIDRLHNFELNIDFGVKEPISQDS